MQAYTQPMLTNMTPSFGKVDSKQEGEAAVRENVFITPTKKDSVAMRNVNTSNSDFKLQSSESSRRGRLMSSPESLFTPLRIPGSAKNDTAEYSKFNGKIKLIELFLMKSHCYCIPDYGKLTFQGV